MSAHIISIKALDAEGRGVGYLSNEDGTPGKVVFVEDALPGETVRCEILKRKSKWELAKAVSLIHESAMRVRPACPSFGICGGCSMQHLEPAAQVAIKQRVLMDALWHIGKVKPETILAPIFGPFWGYRHRARLTVRDVEKKGGVLDMDTRIISITVTDTDPVRAMEIANAVREAASEHILNVMDIQAVNVVETANLPTYASGPNTARNILLGGMLGAALVMGILVVRFLLDDTVKTTEDVERYLGLSVLAVIPLNEGEADGKRRRRKGKRKSMAR